MVAQALKLVVVLETVLDITHAQFNADTDSGSIFDYFLSCASVISTDTCTGSDFGCSLGVVVALLLSEYVSYCEN